MSRYWDGSRIAAIVGATVAACVLFISIFAAAVNVTNSVTERHVAAYEACQHAAPEAVERCIAGVQVNDDER
jgi:hypothetical protein